MPSAAAIKRCLKADEIQQNGVEIAPCSACQKAKVPPSEERPKCILSALSGRCSECFRKNLSHCDVKLTAPEWTKFRDIRDRLRAELEDADEEEIKIIQEQRRLDRQRQEVTDRLINHKAKMIRLKKQLRLAADRTDRALAKEIEEDIVAELVRRHRVWTGEHAGL